MHVSPCSHAFVKFRTVHVVPVHRTFLGHGIHCRKFWTSHYDSRDPHYWYFENIEDPNDRGYDALRPVFLREIAGQRSAISDSAQAEAAVLPAIE